MLDCININTIMESHQYYHGENTKEAKLYETLCLPSYLFLFHALYF